MKKGFTLIELLVVIAVIGMLASIVLVSLGGARQKSRDARRQSDIRQISLAMEMCLDTAACAGGGLVGNYPAITVVGGRITVPFNIGNYLNPLPLDPGGGSSTSCTTDDSLELTVGGYCAYASGAGGEYCIYAKLSNGDWILASEKGVRTQATPPSSMSLCP